jgi:catechol 2,3-dioxygenase-like lactoylglutathione lyase family enzyme
VNLGSFEASLPVKDIARSLAFYEGFGFEKVDGAVLRDPDGHMIYLVNIPGVALLPAR